MWSVRKRASSEALRAEKEGVLQKWSKNIRRWQPRFVCTNRSSLSYFKYNGAPPAPNAVPDFYLDLKDIVKVIRSPDSFTFELYNAKGESVVKLKANGQKEYEAWVEILERKVEFLVHNKDGEDDGDFAITLVTNTFTMLQLMDDTEATEFANESLNEIYAEATEGPFGHGLEGALKGTDRVLQVVEELCEDFRSELRAVEGKPEERKAFLLCERLFRRYYSAIRTRVLLETSSVLGVHVTADDLVKEPLTVIVQVMNFLEERLKSVLAREEISGLGGKEAEGIDSYLCPPEAFTAAIVSQSIAIVDDAWAKEVQTFETRIRAAARSTTNYRASSSFMSSSLRGAHDLLPRFTIVFDTMGEIFDNLGALRDQQQANFLRKKIFTSCLLFISGNFQAINIKDALPNLTVEDEKYIGKMLKELDQFPSHLKRLREKWSTKVIVPEITEVFLAGSQKLMKEIVVLFIHRFLEADESLGKMIALFFASPLWTAGEVTPTVINKFKLFLTVKQDELVPSLHDTLEKRLLRGLLLRYLRQFLRMPQPLQISEEDIFRVVDDETRIKEWVEFGRWSSKQERLDQLIPLRWIRIFLLMPAIPSEILSLYNEALEQAHPSLALPLYDLLRYCLKVRTDVPSSIRKAALASCHECIKQVTARSISPPPLTNHTDILLDLFPQAGQVHITGEPWKFEESGDNDVLLSVASLVVETSAKKARTKAMSQEPAPAPAGPREESEILVTFPVPEIKPVVRPPPPRDSVRTLQSAPQPEKPVVDSRIAVNLPSGKRRDNDDDEGEEKERRSSQVLQPVSGPPTEPVTPSESHGSPEEKNDDEQADFDENESLTSSTFQHDHEKGDTTVSKPESMHESPRRTSLPSSPPTESPTVTSPTLNEASPAVISQSGASPVKSLPVVAAQATATSTRPPSGDGGDSSATSPSTNPLPQPSPSVNPLSEEPDYSSTTSSPATPSEITSPTKSSFLSFGIGKKATKRSSSMSPDEPKPITEKPRRNSTSFLSRRSASFRFLGSKGQGGNKSGDVESQPDSPASTSLPTPTEGVVKEDVNPFGEDESPRPQPSPQKPPKPTPSPTKPVVASTASTSPVQPPAKSNPSEDEPANPFEDDDDASPPPPPPRPVVSPTKPPRRPSIQQQPPLPQPPARTQPSPPRRQSQTAPPPPVPAAPQRRVFGGGMAVESAYQPPPPVSHAPHNPPRHSASQRGAGKEASTSSSSSSSRGSTSRQPGHSQNRRSFGGAGGEWW